MCSFPELGTALLRVGIHKFAGLLYLVRLLLRLRGVGSWGIRAATLPRAAVEAREGALHHHYGRSLRLAGEGSTQ